MTRIPKFAEVSFEQASGAANAGPADARGYDDGFDPSLWRKPAFGGVAEASANVQPNSSAPPSPAMNSDEYDAIAGPYEEDSGAAPHGLSSQEEEPEDSLEHLRVV